MRRTEQRDICDKEGSAEQMSFQCEVLADRTEARQESLRALRDAKTSQRRLRSRVN